MEDYSQMEKIVYVLSCRYNDGDNIRPCLVDVEEVLPTEEAALTRLEHHRNALRCLNRYNSQNLTIDICKYAITQKDVETLDVAFRKSHESLFDKRFKRTFDFYDCKKYPVFTKQNRPV